MVYELTLSLLDLKLHAFCVNSFLAGYCDEKLAILPHTCPDNFRIPSYYA